MYLPPPVRRRLDARVDRAREEGFRAGLAHAAARRSRERHRYVFVVTYGRSGSTLVQGLLNAFPRVLVRGENDLYLLDLYRALAGSLTGDSRDRVLRKARGLYRQGAGWLGRRVAAVPPLFALALRLGWLRVGA